MLFGAGRGLRRLRRKGVDHGIPLFYSGAVLFGLGSPRRQRRRRCFDEGTGCFDAGIGFVGSGIVRANEGAARAGPRRLCVECGRARVGQRMGLLDRGDSKLAFDDSRANLPGTASVSSV